MEDKSVSELVRMNFRTADVFKKWGINYCCGGNLPVAQVCALQGLDRAAVEDELSEAGRPRSLPAAINPAGWPVSFLIDYIRQVHHAYAREAGVQLQQLLDNFVPGHSKKYPYLGAVHEAYNRLLKRVFINMEHKEERVFPYLRQLCSAWEEKEQYGKLFVRTMGCSQQDLSRGHLELNAGLLALRTLTDNYRFGESVCTRHQVIYHKLREFDEDLVQHMHLEDKVLFARAGAMEKELRAL